MVHWDSGGRQPLSKESVFKLRTKDVETFNDMSKMTTSDKEEAYKVFNE